jgi:His/Glu/Gln/Arg/opine family amino acid ABC transporter permease subunit
MVVAIIGIFLGHHHWIYVVGLARLSKNYLVQKFATIYVEVLRNIPLLLQLLFWYKAVLVDPAVATRGRDLRLALRSLSTSTIAACISRAWFPRGRIIPDFLRIRDRGDRLGS